MILQQRAMTVSVAMLVASSRLRRYAGVALQRGPLGEGRRAGANSSVRSSHGRFSSTSGTGLTGMVPDCALSLRPHSSRDSEAIAGCSMGI